MNYKRNAFKQYCCRISDMVVGEMYPEEYYGELGIMINALERDGYEIGYYTDKDIEGFAAEYNHPSLRDIRAEGDEWLAESFNEYLDEHQGEYGAEPELDSDVIYEVRRKTGWDESDYEDDFFDEDKALNFAKRSAKENIETEYIVYEVTRYYDEDGDIVDSEYHEIDSFIEYGD